MEKNGVQCKDEELRLGMAKTVVHKNPSNDTIMYEAILSCSPTQQENILPQHHTGIVDSGANHIYIAPAAPHGQPNTKAKPYRTPTRSEERGGVR